jgi:hypothetical protein
MKTSRVLVAIFLPAIFLLFEIGLSGSFGAKEERRLSGRQKCLIGFWELHFCCWQSPAKEPG